MLKINSKKNKIIAAKDSKGEPSKFELVIETRYQVNRNQEILLNSKIIKSLDWT